MTSTNTPAAGLRCHGDPGRGHCGAQPDLSDHKPIISCRLPPVNTDAAVARMIAPFP
jgi:hypothetical protein